MLATAGLAGGDRSGKRLFLLALAAFLAVLLGAVVLEAPQALKAVQLMGYWMVLLTVALWIALLWRLRPEASAVREWATRRWADVVMIGIVGSVLVSTEPHGYKVLMDEPLLLGTSMGLHLDRAIAVPVRGYDIQGVWEVIEAYLDKRPILYPFLVSVLHDLTGYRVENAFILNGALMFVMAGLVWAWGAKLGGAWGGRLALLLMAGLPMLGHLATGAGFELLNATMILGVAWLGMLYFERRDAASLGALTVGAVLLAQVRYESALFVFPVGVLVVWVWWTDRRVTVPWSLIAVPLLLVPVLWLNRVFEARADSWQLFSKPEAASPFGLEYVPENLAHAVAFFFDPDGAQPNSLLLSGVGVVAVTFWLMTLRKQLPELRRATPSTVGTVFLFGSLAMLGALLLAYFWGKFDDPVIRRLSLPLHLPFALAPVAVLASLRSWPRVAPWVTAAAGVWALGVGVPAQAKHAYTASYALAREAEWRRDFVRRHPSRDYLVVDPYSTIWLVEKVSATVPESLRDRRESVAYHLRNRTFSAIYVFQRFDVDEATGALTPQVDRSLPAWEKRMTYDYGPGVVLETVAERRFKLLEVSRISRVVRIDETEQSPETPGARAAPDEAERQRMRGEYQRRWLANLP